MSNTNVNTPDRVSQMQSVQQEAFNTFVKKNSDYGDAFATYGPVGVIVRIGDKIARLTSVSSSGVNLVEDEPIRDTLMDLHNYAAMAVMLLDEGKTVDNTPYNCEENIPSAPVFEDQNEMSDVHEISDVHDVSDVHEFTEEQQINDETVCQQETGKICPTCTFENIAKVWFS